MEVIINNFKYYCEKCNHGSNSNSDFLKHIKSNKHIRGGLKQKICLECNRECFNHWNLKQHNLTQHSTLEEREKGFKYYCKICDYGSISKDLFERHLNTDRHKINQIRHK